MAVYTTMTSKEKMRSLRGSRALYPTNDFRDPSRGGKENPIGSALTENDHAAFEARWIDRALAVQARLRRVDSMTGAEIVGRKHGNYEGILIPYFHPHSGQVRDYRLRRDQPDVEYDSGGVLRTKQKYLSPPGRSNMLYLVPGTERSFLSDPALPIILTEGEFV